VRRLGLGSLRTCAAVALSIDAILAARASHALAKRGHVRAGFAAGIVAWTLEELAHEVLR